MDYPQTIPLRFIHNLIHGKARVMSIECPVHGAFSVSYKSPPEGTGIPSVGELNALLQDSKVAEAFQQLALLSVGARVTLGISSEHGFPLLPAGQYGFDVGPPERWRNQLMIVSKSQEFLNQIRTDPLSMLEIARLGRMPQEEKIYDDGLLHPASESTVVPNAALLALSHQFDAQGVARILCPLLPDKVIFRARSDEAADLRTDAENNNLWWLLAQRRALDREFDKAVDSIAVNARAPYVQDITEHVCIDYPALSTKTPPSGSPLESLESKLCRIAKQYHTEVAYGIFLNTSFAPKLYKSARKIRRFTIRLEQERAGLTPSTLLDRIRAWFL
ncbi:MAG: hypothetical protein C4532_00020 [Candidatus Abyssobacteria bacterium SURF_17]|uniref:Uncharacterized protein n=1 Tax=Candidatus Abyssobacteria bacterium SURF_17 TaxID=2093361 RepID=A0A419FA11_9BACT|nr:MAG: hypothetical protein C4532_00020 [Candidatus Abyssubacteria bacterium SURF_17]